jgi:hypothetical protein
MADDKTETGGGDRRRVAGNQGYEVTYFARKHGLTAKEARDIIQRVGNDRKKLNAEAKKTTATRSGERKGSGRRSRDTIQPARDVHRSMRSASSKTIGKAAALGGVVAAGALLWSRRTEISDQVSKIVERVSGSRDRTDVDDNSTAPGESDDIMVSSAGSRTGNGDRSQVEIAQEALALKETGHT